MGLWSVIVAVRLGFKLGNPWGIQMSLKNIFSDLEMFCSVDRAS